MLIDSHCHLDYLDIPSVAGGIAGALERGRQAGVTAIIVPAVDPSNFDRVAMLAKAYPEVYFALGIHPMYVQGLGDDALIALQNALDRYRHNPKLIAVGEIGLDHYVPGLNREKMEAFYSAQCQLARDWNLPVILHVRKAQDRVLKHLRQSGITRGIAHAFNGSLQQAQAFIAQGICLGFGGAMTYPRANQIRRLAAALPLESIVLETDSPDIAPAWRARGQPNEPQEIAAIAEEMALLRFACAKDIAVQTSQNLARLFPVLTQMGYGAQTPESR
ncbi:MAG: TatD family hydrolase [Betaproteobacteria bacterium]|jgi:TatD DNase family protein|nr:TatD family hydrolase [Betaproteobacteria bacterium]